MLPVMFFYIYKLNAITTPYYYTITTTPIRHENSTNLKIKQITYQIERKLYH